MNLNNLPEAFTNRYILIERLGEGGMGELYLARDKKLDRSVAVKFILGDEDELSRRRFFREAAIQMRLQHEGIADLIDFSKEPVPYIAFEYVQGMTLFQYVSQRGPLDIDEAVDKMLQVAKAMSYAHRHGILHRDLKAENVMLDEDGRIKIIDFGLARRSDLTSTITKTGVILGTPAYMAPELVKGEKATKQADVYAAGVMFYEMLTGQQPFQGDSPVAIMMKRLHKSVVDPRQLRPSLDDELTMIVMRALAKELVDRYISFDEIVNCLERWRQGEQSEGRATVEVEAIEPRSVGLTTTKNNKIPQSEVEEEKQNSFPYISLILFLPFLVALIWYVAGRKRDGSLWMNTFRLKVSASSCTVQWKTKDERKFSCTVVTGDTRSRVTRQSEATKVRDHEFVISGLDFSTSYVMELKGENESFSRTFITSSVELSKGVFACANKKNLFIDFQSNIESGLQLVVEDSEGVLLSKKNCSHQPPYVIKLPPNVSHGECTWSLLYGRKTLAKGLVSTTIPGYIPPYGDYMARQKMKGYKKEKWRRRLLWVGDSLFATDYDGSINCFKTARTKGIAEGKVGTLELDWIYRSCKQKYGDEVLAGALTSLPGQRLFFVSSRGVMNILSLPHRRALWKRKKGTADVRRLPQWLFDGEDEWFSPIHKSEMVIDLSDEFKESVDSTLGLLVNDSVFFLTRQGFGTRLSRFDLKTRECLLLSAFTEQELNNGRLFDGKIHFLKEEQNWWTAGILERCNGRIFAMMRSRRREDDVTGPYEYVLISWSVATGTKSIDCRFTNLSNVIELGVDGTRGLIWCLSGRSIHRLVVKEGRIVAKDEYKVKRSEYSLVGGVLPHEGNVYFTAHKPPDSLQFGTSFAPEAFDGLFHLFHLNWQKQELTQYHPALSMQNIVATDGALRTLTYIGPHIFGYSNGQVFSFRADNQVVTSRHLLRFSSRERNHSLAGWALRPDGLIAIVAPEGRLYVLPHQLVLYN